jgi:hypothetical protein
MMDDRNDINRPPGSDPYLNRRPVMTGRRGYGWSIPVAIAALLLIAGFMFYNSGGHGPDRTANNSPSATSGPVAPGAPAPGPTSTAPAPNR